MNNGEISEKHKNLVFIETCVIIFLNVDCYPLPIIVIIALIKK